MKKIYFITATNTDVGKSFASEIFLKRLAKKGEKVGYLKPIETGVKKKPLDGDKLFKIVKKLNKEYKKLTLNDIVPYQFKLPAAPYIAKKNQKINIQKIIKTINNHFNYCDTLIVEGAGGLMVPIKKNYFMIDLIEDLQRFYNLKTILISPSNLGNINDTLLSQMALKNYNIDFQWYINLYKDKKKFNKITLPFYKNYFDKIYYL